MRKFTKKTIWLPVQWDPLLFQLCLLVIESLHLKLKRIPVVAKLHCKDLRWAPRITFNVLKQSLLHLYKARVFSPLLSLQVCGEQRGLKTLSLRSWVYFILMKSVSTQILIFVTFRKNADNPHTCTWYHKCLDFSKIFGILIKKNLHDFQQI